MAPGVCAAAFGSDMTTQSVTDSPGARGAAEGVRRLTGAPVAYNGNVFVPVASWEETRSLDPNYPCCTFRGSIVALRIRDGEQVWKTYLGRNRGVGTLAAVKDIYSAGGLPAFWAGTAAKMFESASKGLVLMWAKENLLSVFNKTDAFSPGE